ncbi:MAG: adenylate/guanylate cyclase domain-containing protein [Alphaproteobacteria bacterium]|nr:adenylate/guanylate cyclase domain-containing protein [Alphaproteobacteria bacterium]
MLAADMVGYSRLIGADEEGTITRQKAHRAELIDPEIASHGGRIVKTMGDGLLIEFPSVVDAVKCAVALQNGMAEREAAVSKERRIQYRVGINLGDIVIDGEDILGDGVNVAARLEGLADPGGICVSEKVFAEVRNKVDTDFEDLGPQEVKNIAEPVRVYRVLPTTGQNSEAAVVREDNKQPISGSTISHINEERLAPPDDRPSVAVLPFVNLSENDSEDYFAEGIAEDITTELSRFSSLFVISRMSSFDYRGNLVSEGQVGSELGVGYVLNGSVRRSGDRLRVSVALTDTRTEKQVWAERYDRAAEDVFDVQDEISETVASTLVGRLQKIGTARVQAKKSDSLTAYEYLLRGLDLHKSGVITPESAQLAYEAFTEATKEDPEFARAQAWRACSYSRTWGVPVSAAEIQRCLEFITTALELDPDEAESHRIAGSLYRFLRDYSKADYHISKSLILNPNDAHIIIKAAEHECFMDRPDRARELAVRAMRLNPHFPDWYWEDVGLAEYVAGNCGGTLDSMMKVQTPTYAGFAYWAAAAQEEGAYEEAAQLVEQMRQAYPQISLSVFRDGQQHNCFKNSKVHDRFVQSLSNAGLE